MRRRDDSPGTWLTPGNRRNLGRFRQRARCLVREERRSIRVLAAALLEALTNITAVRDKNKSKATDSYDLICTVANRLF
jgi:hypothetical protein